MVAAVVVATAMVATAMVAAATIAAAVIAAGVAAGEVAAAGVAAAGVAAGEVAAGEVVSAGVVAAHRAAVTEALELAAPPAGWRPAGSGLWHGKQGGVPVLQGVAAALHLLAHAHLSSGLLVVGPRRVMHVGRGRALVLAPGEVCVCAPRGRC